MKRILSTLLLAASVAALVPAQAQTKVAVVDLQKVFDGYWRTKQAAVQLKERQTDFEKERSGLIEEFKKSSEEFRQANEAVNDPAVSAEERERRRKEAEKQLQEVREQENSIRNFDQTSRQVLEEQRGRMRESVLRDIRSALDEKAKVGGFGLVFDLAATTLNQTPVIMYNTLAGTDADLTEVLLKQLNANAPDDGAKVTADPDSDPVPALSGK